MGIALFPRRLALMDMKGLLRAPLVALALIATIGLFAQRIDSVHVFKQLPPGHYSSATANAMAWQLHRSNAAYTAVKGTEITAVTEALKEYKPSTHVFRDLPELTNLAMAFSGGRPLAFGVADDMDLVIDFTARTEYRISSFTDHWKVRALIAKILVTQ